MPDHLILRSLRSADHWRTFHGANASAFVKERDPLQIERAAEAGKLFVLVDEAGRIQGGCGLFEYGDGTFREAGGVRILSAANGFGLQSVLMAVATYSEWVFDPPAAPVIAITAVENAASRKSIVRAGFIEVGAGQLGADRFDAMAVAPDPSKVYFLFPDTAMPAAREIIRDVVSAGAVSKNGRTMKLTLEVPVVTDELL